jgi:hypothetical protein
VAFTDPKSTISIETLIESGELVSTSGTEIRGRFYTETYEGFYFFAEESGDTIDYELRFYDAEVGGTALGSHFITNSPTKKFEASVPVLGPYLEIRFINRGPGTSDTFWRGAVTHWRGILGEDPSDNILIRSVSANLNAGTTRTVTSNTVWPGAARFQFITPSTTYTVTLEYLNQSNTWSVFNQWVNTGAYLMHAVNLPAAPVRASITNNGAAATTAGMFLSTNLAIGN